MKYLVHGASLALPFVMFLPGAMAGELIVPGSTAYIEPDESNVRVNAQRGVVGWHGDTQQVVWFGKFEHSGEIQATVIGKSRSPAETKLRLTIGDSSRDVTASALESTVVKFDFGKFTISQPGYVSFKLESLNGEKENPQIESLQIAGDTIDSAHFNLDPRRNAASVHLAYPVPSETKVERFYTEVTAVTDPTHSFYMACGFHRGYFGMQVNSPTERRIIFSVWDAGNGANADKRDEVANANRVELLDKGPDVHANDFGGEGTGGHSHLVYNWKTGEVQKFLVEAQPDGNNTIFAGYYYHPEDKKWVLISRMRAPKDGGYLKGLHSFSENF
jgi:Domain of unknown function (DUF3472)/Domain of unknown function (DUF5077)